MLQILATIIGLALRGIGVLISRWLRKATVTERIERRLKLVALHQRMKAAGLDAAGLERMEQELHGEASGLKRCEPPAILGDSVQDPYVR